MLLIAALRGGDLRPRHLPLAFIQVLESEFARSLLSALLGHTGRAVSSEDWNPVATGRVRHRAPIPRSPGSVKNRLGDLRTAKLLYGDGTPKRDMPLQLPKFSPSVAIPESRTRTPCPILLKLSIIQLSSNQSSCVIETRLEVVGEKADAGPSVLASDQRAPEVLRELGADGVSYTQWLKASGNLKSTFKDVLRRLRKGGCITQNGSWYRAAEIGPKAETGLEKGLSTAA